MEGLVNQTKKYWTLPRFLWSRLFRQLSDEDIKWGISLVNILLPSTGPARENPLLTRVPLRPFYFKRIWGSVFYLKWKLDGFGFKLQNVKALPGRPVTHLLPGKVRTLVQAMEGFTLSPTNRRSIQKWGFTNRYLEIGKIFSFLYSCNILIYEHEESARIYACG